MKWIICKETTIRKLTSATNNIRINNSIDRTDTRYTHQ